MRIAVLTYQFPPWSGVVSHLVWRGCRSLAGAGHEVTAFTLERPRAPSREVLDGVTVIRIPSGAVESRVRRGLPQVLAWRMGYPLRTQQGIWIVRGLRALQHHHERHPFDALLSRSNPIDSHVFALYAVRRTRLPWVAWLGDPIPRTLLVPEYRNPAKETGRSTAWRRREWRWAERIFLGADVLVFPSPRLADYQFRRTGFACKASIAVINHPGLDWKGDVARKVAGRTLVHCGNLMYGRDPSAFVEAWRRFHHDYTDVTFHHYGAVDRNWAGLLASSDIHAIVNHGWVEHEVAVEAMRRADAFVLIEGDLSEGIYLPGKFAEYASLGRPILALSPAVGTIADLAATYEGIARCSPTDSGAIYDALVRVTQTDMRVSPALRDAFDPRSFAGAVTEQLRRIVTKDRN